MTVPGLPPKRAVSAANEDWLAITPEHTFSGLTAGPCAGAGPNVIVLLPGILA
jgi:hypothetical protein